MTPKTLMQFNPTFEEGLAGVKLCKLRGLDPDDIIMHGPDDGSGHAVCIRSPRWKRAALEIHNHKLIHEAMEEK